MSADSTIRDTFEEMLLAAGKSEEPEKLVEVDEHCGQLIDRRYFVLEHIASGTPAHSSPGLGTFHEAR